jgi:hypothetical protein
MKRKHYLVLAVLLLLGSCLVIMFQAGEEESVSGACADAFREAANVDALHDTHADLYPAYSACTSIEEWREADRRYPEAIDGVDPVMYAQNICAGAQDELGKTPICKAVNVPSPADQESSLTSSGKFGPLNIPLPVGSELTEKYVPKPGEFADPRDSFKIDASAEEIVTFYRRELPALGWFRRGISGDFSLFFGNV